MFEKVNSSHPDKEADRIGGAIVDLGYKKQENPKIAGEILLGHGDCHVLIETSVDYTYDEINKIVQRITPGLHLDLKVVPQDKHLAHNQDKDIRCGDNGIFKGIPVTGEEQLLTDIAKEVYAITQTDGKYVLDNDKLIICQSHINTKYVKPIYENLFIGRTYANNFGVHQIKEIVVNPLGDWTGSSFVDSGCCNRKLGSDMAQSVSGGGLHFKDLSKADVSVNIYAFLKAQETGKPVELSCAIGDSLIDGKPYSEIVKIAKEYIDGLGGFEKFAEWGLVR